MSTTPTSTNDMMSELLTQALTGAFDSLKGKVTANVHDHGEEYLQGAVDRIKESTSAVVEWAKENPMKTALAVAALAAVSTFLVRTIAASGNHSETKTKDADDASKSSKAPRKASAGRQKN